MKRPCPFTPSSPRSANCLYWAAILFYVWALGTAAGDLAAEGLKLGYAFSTLIFGALIAAVTFAYFAFKANAVLRSDRLHPDAAARRLVWRSVVAIRRRRRPWSGAWLQA
ncbi:MAG: hypothetical protein M5R42_12250 [Rhodocyclaceae bacterium]|nr:hypothetical protein [Rhodocyclaceae bacterium]